MENRTGDSHGLVNHFGVKSYTYLEETGVGGNYSRSD